MNVIVNQVYGKHHSASWKCALIFSNFICDRNIDGEGGFLGLVVELLSTCKTLDLQVS